MRTRSLAAFGMYVELLTELLHMMEDLNFGLQACRGYEVRYKSKIRAKMDIKFFGVCVVGKRQSSLRSKASRRLKR